ncbi:MAG TPA: cell division protein SepF [Acholeplasmataceae bacterium]|nr:cell division protein SepF [Acholeplasmataceae bacterium]
MGIFRKKKIKENLEFSEYKTHEKRQGLLTAFDKMEYFVFEEKSDEHMFSLCDTLLKGKPVLANFDKVENANDCNYMLAFISGVVYALEGQAIKLGSRLFLFAGKEELEDGSLLQYVEDIK